MATDFDRRFASDIVWRPFENQSGQDIPPFSIIEASGWQMPDPSGATLITTPLILGELPADPINPYACYITGAAKTSAGANGVCARPTSTTPLLVSLAGSQQESNDAPYRICGPSSGSWQATRDMPGFAMLDLPQQGYAMVSPAPPAQIQLYVTIAGPSATAYPLLSSSPTVYYAQLLQGATFPQAVGTQTLQPIGNTNASSAYLFCDQTYLFEGTIVAALNGVVIAPITGSRFEIGMHGTLTSQLSSSGQATASVTYIDALGNSVDDNLTVYEQMGLTAPLDSGTPVFIEWDNALFNWVVVSAACNSGSVTKKDTPLSRDRSDSPISTGSYAP